MACSHHAKRKNAFNKYIFTQFSDNTIVRLRDGENLPRREDPEKFRVLPRKPRLFLEKAGVPRPLGSRLCPGGVRLLGAARLAGMVKIPAGVRGGVKTCAQAPKRQPGHYVLAPTSSSSSAFASFRSAVSKPSVNQP